MSRLEEIKNEYAKSKNYVCWDQFISDQPNYKKDQAYNDVYIVYAVECCKASLEKASEKVECVTCYDNECEIDLKSITTPENIVLL